jgi:hypothetical protein
MLVARGTIGITDPRLALVAWPAGWGEEADVEFRGHFGEPFCSMGCQLMGSTEAIQALMDGRSGTCRFCGERVTASAYEDRCAVVPLGGAFYFICPDCRDRGKAYLASYPKCCQCGGALS